MEEDGGGPPPWTLGTVHDLIKHCGLSTAASEMAADLADMHAALPTWSADVRHYAEHIAYLSEVHLRAFLREEDPKELGAADAVRRLVNVNTPGVTQLVHLRLQILDARLDIAHAVRDGGTSGLAAAVSVQSKALKAELPHLFAVTLLKDLALIANGWGNRLSLAEEWPAAADALDLGARAADQLIRALPEHERLTATHDFRDLPLDAASALGRAGRLDEAVLTIETARQRTARHWYGLSEMEAIVGRIDPSLYQMYIAHHQHWVEANSAAFDLDDPSAIEEAVRNSDAAESAVVALVTQIRKMPGLEYFSARPSTRELREIAYDAPILYIWTSRFDTAIVLATSDQPTRGVLVRVLTSDWITRLLRPWMEILDPKSTPDHYQRNYTLTIIGATLERWMSPALEDLLTSPDPESGVRSWDWSEVTLVVSGPLSYLPVYVSSPVRTDSSGTITSVLPLKSAPSARQAYVARRLPRPDLSGRRLLSLADPEPRPPNAGPLRCARLESDVISPVHSSLRLHGAKATCQAFLDNVAKFNVLHLACHGSIEPNRPGSAHLELGGGGLGIEDISASGILDHVALAVLSACSSGQLDTRIPDESLDFGSVMLAAGARAVISNVWPADDLASALFVWRFFQLWDWGHGLEAAVAVAATRLWIRNMTVGELKALANADPRWQPHAIRYTNGLQSEEKRFSDPYFWAAFRYAGA